jgi:hypothetical protein
MKYVMTAIQVPLGFGLLLVTILPAYPHGGGLDAYGCHNNRKAGGYHCHGGPLAGQSFNSKEEMLNKLSEEKSDTSKKPTTSQKQ